VNIDFSKFPHDVAQLHVDVGNDFIATMPTGLDSRRKLFDALRTQLQLPDYFGNNWDALSDVLKDLSWIKPRRVIILHQDFPKLDAKTMEGYLDVLSDAAQDWKSGEDHELVVVFPARGEPPPQP
jgi:RNAse (barnase) inhibitor barstar